MGFFKTALFLAALTAIFMTAGWLLGGSGGMLLALGLAVAMNMGAWWYSDKIVLAQYGATEVTAQTAPEFYSMVAELAQRAQLPMPRVYIAPSPQPNAFATGRSPEHAAVCATSGLLERLTPAEVRGVMAHELAHVKHRDTLIMTIAATISGALGNMARMVMFMGMTTHNNRENRSPLGGLGVLVAALLAPLAAMLIQFTISRTREFAADRRGAEISGDPLALASALANLHNSARKIDMPQADANPASAHMFIVNPLHAGGMAALFATHPPMEERIARLQQLASQMPNSQRTSNMSYGGPWGQPAKPELEDTAPRGPWG